MSERAGQKVAAFPVTMFVAVMTAAFGVQGWITSQIGSVRDDLGDKVQRLERIIDRTWTADDMGHWSDILRERNPELDVPTTTEARR